MEFEALKPDKLMKLITNDTDVVQGTISKNLENSGIKTGSILNNLAVFILIFFIALIIVIIVLVARRILKDESKKRKIQKLINKQKEAFMWNKTIASVSISYVKNCLAVSA